MENEEQLRQMILSFRVSELHMLLAYAGRARHGRKSELQERALSLLRLNSQPFSLKIKSLYQTAIQNSEASVPTQPNNSRPAISPSAASENISTARSDKENNMHPGQRGYPTGYGGNQPPVNSRNAPAMYNAALYPQQYPTQMKPMMQLPIHPDVKFKKLPFYDIIADLLQPSSLTHTGNQRTQECTFQFLLTPQQADQIGTSRDIRAGGRTEFGVQVQLRFCLLDTACEQEDFFPPGILVKVNGKGCQLPNPIPTNKPGVEPKRPPRPVNITPLVKISPTVSNVVNVQWTTDFTRGYVLGLFLVVKRSSDDLLNRLKAKGIRSADYTRGMIKDKLRDSDSEIATTSLRVSLACPIGKMRMVTPCRASTCHHFQCFDASLYLQMNEKKPTWMCPVCDKPILYDNLVIDGYFQDILISGVLPSDAHDIQLQMDGSWSSLHLKKENNRGSEKKDSIPVPKIEERPLALPPEKEKKVNNEIICLEDSDDEPLMPKRNNAYVAPSAPSPNANVFTNSGVPPLLSENGRSVSTLGGSSGGCLSPSVIVLDEDSVPAALSACATAAVNPSLQQQQAAAYVSSSTNIHSPPPDLYSTLPCFGNGPPAAGY